MNPTGGFLVPQSSPATALSACIVMALLAASLSTLPWSLRWYNVQELDAAVRAAPSFRPVVPLARFEGEVPRAMARAAHVATSWFGHDDLGRSLFYRLLPGFLLSLLVGLAAAGIAVGIGVLWGAAAGLAGGRVDSLMMRIVDVLYGLPYILMVILLKVAMTRPLAAAFGGYTRAADLVVLLLAIGGVSWLTMARVVRGQVLSLKTQPFVDAARVAGAGPGRILLRHLLPNLVGPMIVCATLAVPQAILQESFLSFLGIGVQAPTPSLGRLAADGVQAVNTFVGYWWLLAFPCGALIFTLLALNLLGDWLRDRFDPKAGAATML
jgi:ABC-type dipeptide/oligopeptide/nickel transport system permease subunit